MERLKIYISGKISGLALEVAEKNFEIAEQKIKEIGHIPVNPMKLHDYKPELTWHDYMSADLAALVYCDAILMLENWEDSRGAKVEKALAEALNLKVYLSLKNLSND